MSAPPAYAIAHAVELMHHYAYVIVHGGCEDIDEMECWKALQYFRKLLPRRNRSEFGRFANSVKLAEISIMLAADPSAEDDSPEDETNGVPRNDGDSDVDDDEDSNDILWAAQAKALNQWTRLDWELLDSRLQAAHTSLLRADADATVTIREDENPQRDQARAKLPRYTKKYDKCRRLIAIHRALAPIRLALEQDLMSDNQQPDPSSIPQFHLQELRQYVGNMEDGKTKEYLRGFFVTSEDSEDLPDEAVLDTRALQKDLSHRLCLTKLKEKIITLLRSWSEDVQRGGRPKFTDLYLPLEAQQGGQDAEEQDDDGRVGDVRGSRALKERNLGARKSSQDGDSEADGRLLSCKDRKLGSNKKNTRKVRDLRHASNDLREAAMDPLAESYSVAKRARRNPQSGVAGSSGHRQNGRHDEQIGDDDSIIDDDDDDNNEHTGTTSGQKTVLTRRKLFAAKPSAPRVARSTHNNDDSSEASSENDNDPPPAKKQKNNSKGISNNTKKKSARQEVWTDSPEQVRLSRLPGGSRESESKPQSKKRRFFSVDEKNALKKGVAKHGAGKWKEILNDFPDDFDDRTSVNLKDLHRTMLKNGEI